MLHKAQESAEKKIIYMSKKKKQEKIEQEKQQKKNRKQLSRCQKKINNLSKESNLNKYPEVYRDLLNNNKSTVNKVNNWDIFRNDDLKQVHDLLDGLNDVNILVIGANISNLYKIIYISKFTKKYKINLIV